MNRHFGDRLVAAIKEKGTPACIGIDPLLDRLPPELLPTSHMNSDLHESVSPAVAARSLFEFGREIVRVAAEFVPVVKINVAFFERYYAEGLHAYYQLVHEARSAGLIVIGDVKRGDIGHSTEQYAAGQLATFPRSHGAGMATPDAATVNPYFGWDGIRPFAEIAQREGKGLFILVHTSNASAEAVQGLTFSDGRTVSECVGELVNQWAGQPGMLGDKGYSSIGAVVSPREHHATIRIRTFMPHCVFLVPGFGAQGQTAKDVACCFKADGTGALVTASRSVIYAYQQEVYAASCGNDWRACVRAACRDFVRELAEILP